MIYTLHIKRQKSPDSEPYFQDFTYETEGHVSVASCLKEINDRSPLKDASGNTAGMIAFDCGCLKNRCGSCGVIVNGKPGFACSVFLDSYPSGKITVEPFSKFPVVRDLITDKSYIFRKIREMEIYLEEKNIKSDKENVLRYISSKCLMCGCCLEVCPNFCADDNFCGAAGAVQAFRILCSENNEEHRKAVAGHYADHFYKGCGGSLSCMDICPARLNIEELVSHATAAAVWKKNNR